MSVAVNDVFSVAAVGSCFNQRIMLTHHYAATGVAGDISDNDALDGLLTRLSGAGDDAWETDYLKLLPPQYILNYWQVQKVQAVRVAYKTETRDTFGTHANNTETANQQGTITLRGALARRDNISNKHIGPLPQNVAVQDDGLLTVGYKTDMANLAAKLCATQIIVAGALTLKPCILHRAPAGSYTLLINYLIGNVVGTMRRRTVGRGI